MVDVIKHWEADRVNCPSTTVPEKIAVLRGGESITITAKCGSNNSMYIGSSPQMTTVRSYQLEDDQSITLVLPATFGRDHAIEIYCLPEVAGHDVCILHLFGMFPETNVSS